MRAMMLFILGALSGLAQSVTLTQYLSLTSQQAGAIRQLNADYTAYLTLQSTQLGSLSTQLANLYNNPVPDPFSIGARYVSSENIRRDMATHLATFQQQVAAQLTPAQLALLPGLSAAIILQPLISDAQCAFLASSQGTSPLAYYSVPTTAYRAGDFTGALVLSATPYIPPAPTGTFCGSAQFPIDVREYFNIADSQVSAFVSASASYQDYYLRQQNRIADLQVQIRDETAKPSPDPNTLGMYYVQLAVIGQDMQKQAAMLSKSATAVLSTDQLAKLTALQNTAALLSAANQGIQCGLISTPPGTLPTFTFFNPAAFGPACQI